MRKYLLTELGNYPDGKIYYYSSVPILCLCEKGLIIKNTISVPLLSMTETLTQLGMGGEH